MTDCFEIGLLRLGSLGYRWLPNVLVKRSNTWRSNRKCLFDPELPIFIHLPKNDRVPVSNSPYGHMILHISADNVHDAFAKFYDARKYIVVYRAPFFRLLSAANSVRTGGIQAQTLEFRSYYATSDRNHIHSHLDFLAYPEAGLDYAYWSQTRSLRDDATLYGIKAISEVLGAHGGLGKKTVNQYSRLCNQNDLTGRWTEQLRSHFAKDFKLAARIWDNMSFNRAVVQ